MFRPHGICALIRRKTADGHKGRTGYSMIIPFSIPVASSL